MSKSPVNVQQWVDMLPSSSGTTAANSTNIDRHQQLDRRCFPRDISMQSDDASSHCSSSVESVLEQRKPDPEAVLLGLGFGPTKSSSILSRIPSRFLQPSKLLPQMDFNKFLEQYATSNSTKYPEQQQHSASSSPARTCRPK